MTTADAVRLYRAAKRDPNRRRRFAQAAAERKALIRAICARLDIVPGAERKRPNVRCDLRPARAYVSPAPKPPKAPTPSPRCACGEERKKHTRSCVDCLAATRPRCSDCNARVSQPGRRCRPCASRAWHAARPARAPKAKVPCATQRCPRTVSARGVRCYSCAAKQRWRDRLRAAA